MFSDDNLQQLKRELNQRLETIGIWAPCLQSLIERLEAAEKYIDELEAVGGPEYVEPEDNALVRKALEAWKRSAGKEI